MGLETDQRESMAVDEGEDAPLVMDAIRDLDPANNVLYAQADELAFGRLFADVFKDRARFHETARCWYFYDGVVWRPDREGLEVDAMAKLLQRSLWSYCGEHGLFEGAFQKFVAGLGQRSRREKIILDAKSYYPIHAGELDSQPYLLNTMNCVIDLRTGETLEHDPSLLLSQVCNCEYKPDVDGTLVQRFIAEVMSNDGDKARYLQSICGYALTGNCEQEEMYLLYGATTRNGKSTLCDTLEYMVGGYGAHIQPETLATKDRNSRNASGDIARLDGVRFLHCSEPPKRMVFDIALLKTMTGRDTITARNLYEREFEFVPVFTLIVNSNYLPIVNDDTFFTSGRCKVVPFDRHFTPDEQDTTLKARLREPENLSALLNWCLEGLRIYRAQGNRLIEPQSVIAATEAYREQSDKLKSFMLDCFVEHRERAITAKQAYASYQKWCQDSGYGCENRSNFYAELRSKGLLRASATVGGRTVRNVIVGYTLDDENPFDM